MTMRMTVEGIPELDAALKELPAQVRYNLMVDAIRPAAELVQGAIKARAIFGPYSRGERGVKGSITVLATQVGGEPSAIVKPDKRKGGGGRHAHLVEFPVAPHAGKYFGKKAQHPGTRGQPFFNPGVEASQDAAMDLMERGVSTRLETYWQSQGGNE